jgi:hypothetical protein
VPHFRRGAWNFLRGATCTVDRPLLGWAGRYFLHNISHDHVSHHFFSQMPFCAFSLLSPFSICILLSRQAGNERLITGDDDAV